MPKKSARLLIGGIGSDCGKTTVTSAILRAWQRRGVPLAAFKCGPDYIDPMFHKAVLGIPSRNLDLFFVNEHTARAELSTYIPQGGVGVIEGAMGFYDGVSNADGATDEASAAHLARAACIPSVLVVRPHGQSLSLAAVLSGFRSFAPNTLAGVILNGVSKGMYSFYRDIVLKSGLRCFGCLPFVSQSELPRRHLGLVTAGEIEDLRCKLEFLADAADESLELDELFTLANTAPPISDKLPQTEPIAQVRIAIAWDRAFCFYYEDNLDILRKLGAELVPFSPLEDAMLPKGIQGLYLGGGYPELYLDKLASNKSMRACVRDAVESGLPTIAECGGFQYLHKWFEGHPMAGVFPFSARMTTRLQHFGYVTLTAQKDNLLCCAGESIRGHEFHYGVSDNEGSAFYTQKTDGRGWRSIHTSNTLYAGYPHICFASNPESAARFVRKCSKHKPGGCLYEFTTND